MDNLTHSLVGALLGQMGLKRRTGLAMPTLIVAANIPDIDATCTVLGMVSLAMRRGVTHGPIAMLLLPVMLTGAMIAFDRWQTRRGTRPPDRLPVRPGWLLALAFIGCLSHPFFDWLNSYGVRLLEPFSHEWFYGDALFIVDPWLLAMLIAGVWVSQRREKVGASRSALPACIAFAGISMFIALNGAISSRAEALAHDSLTSAVKFNDPVGRDVRVVANPVPLRFWHRNILWRDAVRFGEGRYDALSDRIALNSDDWSGCFGSSGTDICVNAYYTIPRLRSMPTGTHGPLLDSASKRDPVVRAFLFWSRMPVVSLEEGRFMLRDQRFMGRSIRGFTVELPPR